MPDRGAAASVLAISSAPSAVRVALARHGSHEDSTRAPLPADYPYPARMRAREYEALKTGLQIELLKVQKWVKETGQRIVTLFEGRDAAGKGGTIKFLRQCPEFERMLVNSGVRLVKYWFSVSRQEQMRRFISRRDDPLKQWKLSPLDIRSLDRWDDYSEAKTVMFSHTDTSETPWVVIKSDDKKRARINCLRHFLTLLEYPEKNAQVACAPDPLLVGPAAKVVEEAERVLPGIQKQMLKARRGAMP